jgi:hypothetical protein
MQRMLTLSLITWVGSSRLLGDVSVGSGQSWPFELSGVPLIESTLPSSTISGASMVTLRFSTDPGVQCNYYVEMFRTSSLDSSSVQGHIQDYSTPGVCYVGGYNVWNDDFQGSIRLHVTSGSMMLHEVDIHVWNPGGANGLLHYELISAVEKPALHYTRISSSSGVSQIDLSWPTNAPAYRLQLTESLASGKWLDVTNTAVSANGKWTVILDIRGEGRFFRLENR